MMTKMLKDPLIGRLGIEADMEFVRHSDFKVGKYATDFPKLMFCYDSAPCMVFTSGLIVCGEKQKERNERPSSLSHKIQRRTKIIDYFR